MSTSRLESIRATERPPARLRGETPVRLQPEWLTDAVRESVHGERGRAKAIALALNVAEGAVTDAADPTRRVSLKAYWIPAIVAESGCFAILDALERAVGRVAFQLPRALSADHADIVQHTGQSMQEFSEVLSHVAMSIQDGTITAVECQRLEQQIDEAQASLERVRVVARHKVAA